MKKVKIVLLATIMTSVSWVAMGAPSVTWSNDGHIPGLGTPILSSTGWLIHLVNAATADYAAGTLDIYGTGTVFAYNESLSAYPWTGGTDEAPIGTLLSVVAYNVTDLNDLDSTKFYITSINTFTVVDPGDPVDAGKNNFAFDMGSTWQAIPEPGTFAMMGLGVAAIRFVRWRRRRRAA